MFDIGEEVVCIDASPTSLLFPCDLQLGAHYHVSWIGMYTHPRTKEEVLCVRLIEVRRQSDIFLEKLFDGDTSGLQYQDIPFRATRFAPLRKAKTDISALQELTQIKELEDA